MTIRRVGRQPVPIVAVVTAHGRQVLDGAPDESVLSLLSRHGVPWSAVSLYSVLKSSDEPRLCAGLDAKLSDFGEDVAEILVYFNRNVNPFQFALQGFKTVDPADTSNYAAEYFYQRLDNAKSTCETFLKKLSPDECREVITERVTETVRQHVPHGTALVVGVSGGGDSNALLHALASLGDHVKLHPVIIKGIPDWDAGVPRAQQLCEQYQLELRVMEEFDVRRLLGFPLDSVPLIDRFEHEFQGDDFEFLGTLLVRLALMKLAREVGTRFICTGVNLEDALCENLFRISSGLKPAGVPIRAIGDVSLVFPLWLCPKRIIDGCFPKYSKDNYEARYPCFSLGRNLYYSVIYAMQSQFPAFLEQMARGLSELSLTDPVTYQEDEQLGFHVERFVPLPLRQKFLKMLGRTATV